MALCNFEDEAKAIVAEVAEVRDMAHEALGRLEAGNARLKKALTHEHDFIRTRRKADRAYLLATCLFVFGLALLVVEVVAINSVGSEIAVMSKRVAVIEHSLISSKEALEAHLKQ